MKYLATAVILTAIFSLAHGDQQCYVCQDADGKPTLCDGTNELAKTCGDQVFGCVEEISIDKGTNEKKTMRFCMDPSSPHSNSEVFSYFAPMVAERSQVNETIVKGCMRWNTDKYQVGVYVCDTSKCNKDLDVKDCAHVCNEREQPARSTHHLDVLRSPKTEVMKQDSYNGLPSRCWSCTREENGETINTLCSDENMKVVNCSAGAVGCVESLMTFGPMKHDLRHCMFPSQDNSRRDTLPIKAFDDEIYVKGCLKYYTPPSTQVDLCICDEDECNKDCDCDYECDNVASTPVPPDTTTTGSQGGGGGASSIASTASLTLSLLAVAALFA